MRATDAAMKKYSTQRVETRQSVSMRLYLAVPNGNYRLELASCDTLGLAAANAKALKRTTIELVREQ